jgi:heme-degrading monooxygenase HmoA
MFARFTIIHTDIHKIDEAAKLFEESVVPAFQSQKGYQAVYFLTDRNTGKNICVSIWETEEAAIQNEKSRSYQEQLVKFMDLFTEPPIREGYEVIVRAQLE